MMPLWIISLLALELLTIGLLLGTAYREWQDERFLERLILGEHRAPRARSSRESRYGVASWETNLCLNYQARCGSRQQAWWSSSR